jgi:hypothetical protein
MKYLVIIIAIATISAFLYCQKNTPVSSVPYTANDRAAWGIGADGYRVVPQPATIHFTLK